MGLLTNDEVIAVDQDPAARPARKAWHQGNFQVWMKELSDGSVAAGFFNTGKEKGILKVNLKELGFPERMRQGTSGNALTRGPYREIWR